MVQEAIFQGACFQPLINHPTDHTIRNSLVKKVSKVGVRNRIEVFYDAMSSTERNLWLMQAVCKVCNA